MKRFFIPLLWIALLFGGGSLLAVEAGRVSLERTLSHFLHLPVRIHRISLSPRRLTLHQISVAGSPVPLRIERLQIQAPLSAALAGRWDPARMESITLTGMTVRVGGIPLRAQGRLFLREEEGVGRTCDGWLTLRHPLLKGRVEISGPIHRPVGVGWVEGPQGRRRHFAAQMEIAAHAIRLARLELPEGWIVSGSFGKGRAVLWLHPPDHVPQNLTVSWEKISRSAMNFTARFLGDRISTQGRIGLESPYPLDLFLDFKDAPAAEIASWILPPNKVPRLAGSVRGRVVLKGRLKQVLSRGELVTGDGRFNRELINGMTLRFQGKGPILTIQDSRLSKPEGILLMEGTLDLRRLGQSDFFSRLHLLPMEKALHFPGWGVLQRKAARNQTGVDLAYGVD